MTDKIGKAIEVAVKLLLKATDMGWVPKGYLTKLMAALKIVAGVGLLAASAFRMMNGEPVDVLELQNLLGFWFVADGGKDMGLRRAIGE